MATVEVWTLATCIPEDREPQTPDVFLTEAAAEKAFKDVMRQEWGVNGPVWDEHGDDAGETLPFPEHLSAQEIHDQIVAATTGNDTAWGQYLLTHHILGE